MYLYEEVYSFCSHNCQGRKVPQWLPASWRARDVKSSLVQEARSLRAGEIYNDSLILWQKAGGPNPNSKVTDTKIEEPGV
jgi:hypothetical protein